MDDRERECIDMNMGMVGAMARTASGIPVKGRKEEMPILCLECNHEFVGDVEFINSSVGSTAINVCYIVCRKRAYMHIRAKWIFARWRYYPHIVY